MVDLCGDLEAEAGPLMIRYDARGGTEAVSFQLRDCFKEHREDLGLLPYERLLFAPVGLRLNVSELFVADVPEAVLELRGPQQQLGLGVSVAAVVKVH